MGEAFDASAPAAYMLFVSNAVHARTASHKLGGSGYSVSLLDAVVGPPAQYHHCTEGCVGGLLEGGGDRREHRGEVLEQLQLFTPPPTTFLGGLPCSDVGCVLPPCSATCFYDSSSTLALVGWNTQMQAGSKCLSSSSTTCGLQLQLQGACSLAAHGAGLRSSFGTHICMHACSFGTHICMHACKDQYLM
eukprot:1139987-Pelagomonas_calceolata.AAC.5